MYGRNIVQHERPAQMVRALMAVIHEGATAEQALGVLEAAPANA